MTLDDVENLFEDAIKKHSCVAKRVLETQSKVEQVLRAKKGTSAADSTLITAVVAEAVEEEVEKKGNPVEGFWKMFSMNVAGT